LSESLDCDVLIVGGGINGAGIARDCAGRGLRVVLAEKDDLASHTSSSSTKLIHGGLGYLEYYEFALVRKALAEREVLLRSAPHIMWPLRFVMPHDPGMRPVWMIRAGLFLYDHLARREVLPGSTTVDLRSPPAGAPLKRDFRKGFVYSDGWVDDARLVVRGLPSLDDFRFCCKLGASLFQGPFITSREDWSARDPGPNTARIGALIARLRADADTRELAALAGGGGATSGMGAASMGGGMGGEKKRTKEEKGRNCR